MIRKKLDNITEEDIEDLIVNEELESKTIEYKSELPPNNYESRKKFLASVVSFINTIGGDLIFGIQEDRSTGKPSSHEGISLPNAEQEVLRLEQMIRNGIEPIPPSSVYRTKIIQQQNNNYIFILRLGRSWLRPHRISLSSKSKFYARATNGKYPMDIQEIRSSILLSETVVNQIRQFKEERVSIIDANESFAPLNIGPKIIIHILPIASFELGYYINASQIRTQRWRPIYSSNSFTYRFNIDGLIYYDKLQNEQNYYTYVQIFRNGLVEAVDARLLQPDEQRKIFLSPQIENQILVAIKRYLGSMINLGIELPYFIFITFTEIKDYTITLLTGSSEPIDRDTLLLPEFMIETEDYVVEKLIKSTFDSLYNAFGLENHFHFNEEGSCDPSDRTVW